MLPETDTLGERGKEALGRDTGRGGARRAGDDHPARARAGPPSWTGGGFWPCWSGRRSSKSWWKCTRCFRSRRSRGAGGCRGPDRTRRRSLLRGSLRREALVPRAGGLQGHHSAPAAGAAGGVRHSRTGQERHTGRDGRPRKSRQTTHGFSLPVPEAPGGTVQDHLQGCIRRQSPRGALPLLWPSQAGIQKGCLRTSLPGVKLCYCHSHHRPGVTHDNGNTSTQSHDAGGV